MVSTEFNKFTIIIKQTFESTTVTITFNLIKNMLRTHIKVLDLIIIDYWFLIKEFIYVYKSSILKP